MVSGTLETGRECSTEGKVIASIDCHFFMELAKMEKGG